MSPHPGLVVEPAQIEAIARGARRVAVLGIKPETRSGTPAHYVPAYLHGAGIEIVPVPVYYPEVTHILDAPVERDLRRITPPVDIVDVFRRSADVAGHLEDLLALAPAVVWLQSGIRDDETAASLAEAGIRVVQDRCLMVEHRRATA